MVLNPLQTDLEIARLALVHLGERTDKITDIETPLPAGQLADTIKLVYPVIRQACYSAYDWKFASYWEKLSAGTATTTDNPNYAYEWDLSSLTPTVCAVREVLYESGTAAKGTWDFSNGYFVTSIGETPTIRYSGDITDPTKFTPGFREVFAIKLAARLVMSATQNDQRSDDIMAKLKEVEFEHELNDAQEGFGDKYNIDEPWATEGLV